MTAPKRKQTVSTSAEASTSMQTQKQNHSEPKVDSNAFLSSMRSWRDSATNKIQYQTAIFWGEKIVQVTNSATDRYLLGYLFYLNAEYKRAIFYLQRIHDLNIGSDAPAEDYQRVKSLCHYLSAKCHLALDKLDDAYGCLESIETELFSSGENMKVQSSIELLKGEIMLKRNNFTQAKDYLRRALSLDVRCFEALELLVSKNLLCAADEHQLLRSLKFEEQLGKEEGLVVRQIYHSFMTKTKATQQNDLVLYQQIFGNTDAADVERLYYQMRYKDCLNKTTQILNDDPFNMKVLVYHAGCLVESNEKPELFMHGHQLVENYPKSPESWYVIGCYYMVSRKPLLARKAFMQSTTCDGSFVPSWIGYGHTFSIDGESDQAIAAYSTASRLSPNSHLPKLFMGMQYSSVGNYDVAIDLLKASLSLNPEDPLGRNELGVILYQQKLYDKACKMFKAAADLAMRLPNPVSGCEVDSILVNLGHSYIKLGKFDEALQAFQKAAEAGNMNVQALLGSAYSNHLLKNTHAAIELYHEVLSLNGSNSFAQLMLEKALTDVAGNSFWKTLGPIDDSYRPVVPEHLKDDFIADFAVEINEKVTILSHEIIVEEVEDCNNDDDMDLSESEDPDDSRMQEDSLDNLASSATRRRSSRRNSAIHNTFNQ